MPLFKIPNQPLFPDENNPTDELCSADYCHLVASDDPIYAQWYQTPCGINEACDPDMTDVSYTPIHSQDFTSTCPGAYVLAGGWICSGGLTGSSSIANGTATLNPAGITQWENYKIEVTIGAFSQGWVEIFLGSTGASTSSGRITTGGTYTFYLTNESAVNSLIFLCSGTGEPEGYFNGTVESVTVTEVSMTCWNNGSGTWVISGTGGACKTDTTLSGDLDDGAGGNYLTAGNYYKLEVVISGYTSGTLTPKVGGTSGDVIEGNGTFTRYIEAGASTYVAFTPSTDFIGCVESIDIRELKYTGDYTVTIVDADSLAEIEDVTTYVTFYNQYVTLCVKPSDIALGQGCYRIYVYDTCDIQYGEYVTNPTLSGGGSPNVYDLPTNWYRFGGSGANSQFDFSGSSADVTYNAATPGHSDFPYIINEQNINFVAGNYRITFDIVANTDTTNNGVYVFIQTGQSTAATLFKTVGTHTYDVVFDPDGGADTIFNRRVEVLWAFTANGTIEVDNVQVTRLAPYDATYVSDCFKVVADASRTKLLIGTCDTEQFGFEFANSGFKLLHRVECRAFNPSWTMSQDDYTFSTGSTERNYAEIEKFWELFIEACPATTHGTIALQINCDNFEIGDTETDTKTYITSPGDYTPEWDRTGASDIAPSRLQLKIKSEGMLFNRKC